MQATRTISRKCKQLRRLKGLTRNQLAMKTGLSKKTILRIEDAEQTGYNPHLDTLNYLARGLNIGLADLLASPIRSR